MVNSAGEINGAFNEADFMLIHDHISLMPLVGQDPMEAPYIDSFGTIEEQGVAAPDIVYAPCKEGLAKLLCKL